MKGGVGYGAFIGGLWLLGLHLEIADMGRASIQLGGVGGVDWWPSYSGSRKYLGGQMTVIYDVARFTRSSFRIFGTGFGLEAYQKSKDSGSGTTESSSHGTVGFGLGIGFASGAVRRSGSRYYISAGFEKLDNIATVLIQTSKTFL
jgi:hypothetical protein